MGYRQRESLFLSEKKEQNRIKLSQKYYGKRDLVSEWEPFPDLDPDYVRDLKRRVRGHYLDLVYRGAEGFAETKQETNEL
jgi:hypothetical protein